MAAENFHAARRNFLIHKQLMFRRGQPRFRVEYVDGMEQMLFPEVHVITEVGVVQLGRDVQRVEHDLRDGADDQPPAIRRGVFDMERVFAERQQPHRVRRLAVAIEDDWLRCAVEFCRRAAIRLVESDEHPSFARIDERHIAVLQFRVQNFADHVVQPFQIGLWRQADDTDGVFILENHLTTVLFENRNLQRSITLRKIAELCHDLPRLINGMVFPRREIRLAGHFRPHAKFA